MKFEKLTNVFGKGFFCFKHNGFATAFKVKSKFN